jgi:hypothetical protein
MCIVCKREVPQGYEQDHLRVNHLGPHTFWFDMRKYITMEPSMRAMEVKRLADATPLYQMFEERDGKQVYFGDSESVDLTHGPHFFAVPPATMFCGSGVD